MIEMESFEKGMAVLAERFRAPLAPDAQKGYYAILSEELDTAEFRVAVKLAFRHAQFWPSPQQLIDFVHPPRNLAAEASSMFQRLLDAGENTPNMRIWRRDRVTSLGKAALAGFDAIGGNERLRNLEARDMAFARREFVEAYKAKATETEAQRQITEAQASLVSPPRARRAIQSGPVAIGSVIDNMPKVEA